MRAERRRARHFASGLKDGAIGVPVRIGRVDDHNVVALKELLVIRGLVFCTQQGDFACLCGLVGGRRGDSAEEFEGGFEGVEVGGPDLCRERFYAKRSCAAKLSAEGLEECERRLEGGGCGGLVDVREGAWLHPSLDT